MSAQVSPMDNQGPGLPDVPVDTGDGQGPGRERFCFTHPNCLSGEGGRERG